MPRPRLSSWFSDPPEQLDLTHDQETALRRTQLELLAEFDRVCAKVGVEYFALYGTALGAVRHEGFIPWDDDLDLGMLRPDYEKLNRVIASELGDDYLWQTTSTDNHYGYLFGKIRKRDSRCVDRISYGSRQHNGVFVDIFPLDARASSRWGHRRQKALRYVGFRLLYIKSGYQFVKGSTPARLLRVAFRGAVSLIPRRAIVALTAWPSRVDRSTAPKEWVSLYGGYFYDRDTIPAEWIHPLQRVPFEDITIPAFADLDSYLTRIYGDYRQPPPPEQRYGRHEIVELSV